ncbi:MAG TPA: recombinase family protein [bacterium]|jgi:DNA invertase Pin-like site-specific DNA recombinase|nr:recombinase family protein [bacterium]
MINKTKGAWILARNTGETKYNLAKNQISAMQSEIHDEGYVHTGTSTLHFPLQSELGRVELNRVLTAASAGRISAVFVFSIRKLSEDAEEAFRLVDRLNELGVIVYDNEGYQYSYDWHCKQIGKRFKGGDQ